MKASQRSWKAIKGWKEQKTEGACSKWGTGTPIGWCVYLHLFTPAIDHFGQPIINTVRKLQKLSKHHKWNRMHVQRNIIQYWRFSYVVSVSQMMHALKMTLPICLTRRRLWEHLFDATLVVLRYSSVLMGKENSRTEHINKTSLFWTKFSSDNWSWSPPFTSTASIHEAASQRERGVIGQFSLQAECLWVRSLLRVIIEEGSRKCWFRLPIKLLKAVVTRTNKKVAVDGECSNNLSSIFFGDYTKELSIFTKYSAI